MVFVMDKMKDHSCAIQPAFGIGGGGGFNGLNFALMLDQVFNPENFLDEEDAQLDAVMNLPPFNPTGIPPFPFPTFESLNFIPVTPTQLQPIVTEQSNQAPAIQQHGPSVAEMVSNAIHHHIATHHALMNNASGTATGGANNAHQPTTISISEMMQNAIQEQLSPPPVHIPSIPGVVAHSIQYQVLSDTPGSLPVSVSADQPQLLISLPSNNGFGMQQYVIGPGQSPPINVGDFSLDIHFSTTNSGIQQPSTSESLPSLVLLNDAQETVPAGEDPSNPSVPPSQVPFSSHTYPFSPSESSVSHEYGPPVASNIVIIDSAESPVDADENQSNHTNVPN